MLDSKPVNKHQTNMDYNRGTITISSCGIASVSVGTCFYLVKAEKIDTQNFKGDFAKNHKAHIGSKVIPTPDAYMTDKVWNKPEPDFYKGLRDLLVKKDYP